MAWKGRKPIINAPYWYNTPLEKLDFEWSREEKVLIDRNCDQIRKNIDEEGGMTPLERWKATMFGGDKDRMLTYLATMTVYASHAMDSHCDAIKPIDIYRYPKLFLLAHLATAARFKLDYCNFHNINYGEDMWGGQSRMIDYGNPIIEPPYPVQSMEDFEGMPIPDTRKDGLYPGYLWANREYRRILEEHNLPLPLWTSICPGPDLLMMMGMTGWTEFSMFLRRKPELIKKGMDIATEFLIGFGKSMIDECKPDGIWM
ncbi:hypothetical protein ACFLTQ_00765 [Chloroflexota bacterium]